MSERDADALGGTPVDAIFDGHTPTDKELERILPTLTAEQRVEVVLRKYLGGATASNYDGETAANVADARIAKYLLRKLRPWLPPEAAEQQRDALLAENAKQAKEIGWLREDVIKIDNEREDLEAERDTLLGRLAQIEQEMRDIADMREPATDLDDRMTKWADTLRDLRVRSTPRTQEPTL